VRERVAAERAEKRRRLQAEKQILRDREAAKRAQAKQAAVAAAKLMREAAAHQARKTAEERVSRQRRKGLSSSMLTKIPAIVHAAAERLKWRDDGISALHVQSGTTTLALGRRTDGEPTVRGGVLSVEPCSAFH